MKYSETFEEAERFESVAARLIRMNIDNRDAERSEKSLAVLNAIQRLVPPGRYEHFKSTPENPKFYRVTGVVEDVNTGLCYVKYAAEYGAYAGVEALRVLAGPDSFLRPIDRDSYRGVRFRMVPDDNTLEVD